MACVSAIALATGILLPGAASAKVDRRRRAREGELY